MKNKNNETFNASERKAFLAVLLLMIALFPTSCVYFNTFYNAEKYFESAQSYSVPETGRPPARAIQDYDKVIEKCTYIINEYPNSKWADDALYLLARSLFYQRRNVLQAKQRFNDLLRVFPDSPYVPESMIYIARIDYQLNNFTEAFRSLSDVLNEQQYESYHPRVLLLRSEWHLADGDINLAQEDLNLIITGFSASDEYQEAYLRLGMSYLEGENYQQSKELFESLLASRVPRRIRFDARYNVALSNFYLKDYQTVHQQLDSLIRDEYEENLFARLYLLRARTNAAQKTYEEAEALFERVIEDNRRTAISAEACYHLAEMYFINLSDYEKALEYYNRVSTEQRSSPFVQKSMGRSSVVSQLIQLQSGEQALTTQKLVQEQFRLAEYYLYEMNMPDSTLSVYRSIRRQQGKLVERRNNLQQLIEEARQDTTFFDTNGLEDLEPLPETDEQDSEESSIQPVEDTFQPVENDIHEEFLDYDSDEYSFYSDYDGEYETRFEDYQTFPEDEMDTPPEPAPDTTVSPVETLVAEKNTVIDAINQYETEFVPYSLFLSAWVSLNKLNDRDKALSFLHTLEDQYPANKYFFAAQQLLKGEKVSLSYPIELEKERLYEEAVSLLQTDEQQGLSMLSELLDEINRITEIAPPDSYPILEELRTKILYSMGFSYYFDLKDSTNAREFFDKLLTEAPQSDYSRIIGTFYREDRFIVIDSLYLPPLEKDIPDDELLEDGDQLSETPIDDYETEEDQDQLSETPIDDYETEIEQPLNIEDPSLFETPVTDE